MPKHTMHCSPDLVTVLPCWFICSLLLCCWLVGPPPWQRPPPPWRACLRILWVCMAYWETIYKNQIPQKTKQKKSLNWRSNAPSRFCHLNVLLWRVSVTLSTGKVLCIQIYLNGMFYQRENTESAKYFPSNYINNVAAYLNLHFTTVNIICTYSFLYILWCFLNYALIKNEKNTTVIFNFKVWV